MSQTVRGVISRSKGAPVELVDIVVPDPGPGEAVVDITACGVCHTDLTYREGGINDEYPFLLGHEAAGTVESVGPGVTNVQPGDFVILNWRAVCGQCRACKRGRPRYCFDTFNAEQKMTLTDGTELTPALGIGAFADKTLVHSGQCTKVDPQADPAVAGLLGCGVMAGMGAAVNTGAVSRDDTVAVIGCGGVGDAAIAGAALVGAKRIIAVDTDNTKLDWARKFGATHTVNAREFDVVKTIQDLTDGFGADVVIDAVGRPETWKQAFYARDLAGTVVLVGVPTPDMRLDMPLVDFFSHGGALKSSWYGDCLPERDFPTLIDLYLQGRLPLDRFVSERIGLGDVEEAFHKMHDGKVLRSVVVAVMGAIDRIVTHGTFELDGGSWEVDNNIWLVGDDSDVVVFDAAHTAEPILEAVDGRHVVAVVCTHGHNDHVTVAPELGEDARRAGPAAPGDDVLWRMTHPDKDFRAISDGDTLNVAGTRIAGAAHPGPLPRIGVLVCPRPGRGVQRRHAVLRRARARPDARTPTSRPFCSRYQSGSESCPATPSCIPAMATTPTSATRSSTTRNGSPAGTSRRRAQCPRRAAQNVSSAPGDVRSAARS